MFKWKQIEQLDAYFATLSQRGGNFVYACRFPGYTPEVETFLRRYDQAARTLGCVIDGGLANPTEQNLAYYNEMMGMDFQLSLGFLTTYLQKWLPRMNSYQSKTIATSLYDTLLDLRKTGKNDAILKNIYIKFMCWMYYRFESVLRRLGDNTIPKILYQGDLSAHGLKLLTILSNAGCDVVLVEPQGDGKYRSLDATGAYSQLWTATGAFPGNFSLKQLRQQAQQDQQRQQLFGAVPGVTVSTNTWGTGKALADVAMPPLSRQGADDTITNCFYRMVGAEDRLTYVQELYQFYTALQQNHRKMVVIDGAIQPPTLDEINGIVRGNYQSLQQMIVHLSQNIRCTVSKDLQALMHRGFVTCMLRDEGMDLRKKLNLGVYLLCWLNRYQSQLFSAWQVPEVSCFLYFGPCQTNAEALFLYFLTQLPVDVLLFSPNLNTACTLEEPTLKEQRFSESLELSAFPQGGAEVRMGTAAYHAERDLNEVLYTDSGLYRTQQYATATALTLHTMYEEIAILWKSELKYRPGFQVVGETVHLPVIFAKVSGVKDGAEAPYWADIRSLAVQDAYVVSQMGTMQNPDANPIKAHASSFFKRGRVLKRDIVNHRAYPYGFLRSEMQTYILDKLQLLIDEKRIKGTFENGMEYTIIATVLNMNQQLLRMIQAYDFTRTAPRLIYMQTGQGSPCLEDAILLAFLNMIGFDIVMFVPTGYQCVEQHYNTDLMDIHNIGTYVYDLVVPDFSKQKQSPGWGWKLFGRGI